MTVICIAGLVKILQADIPKSQNTSLSLTSEQIQQLARSITVQILSKTELGSGVIINRQDNVYTVITNAHVLRAGKSPYQVKVDDGKVYAAEVIKKVDLTGKDLALLQFQSQNKTYPVAKLGKSSLLTVGDEVFAGGFPMPLQSPESQRKFVLKSGRVSLLLEKPLEDGYQIGYTNEVEKGMSGGPLLNIWGEVVAINGLHGEPLWESPDYYEDGSQPCPPLQQLISRYSFGIPINVVIETTPNISLSTNNRREFKFNQTFQEKQMIQQLQTQAQKAQKCQE